MLLFLSSALGTDPRLGKVSRSQQPKVEERKKLLDLLKKELEDSRRSLAQFSHGPTTFRHCSQKQTTKENCCEGQLKERDNTPRTNEEPSPSCQAIQLVTTVPLFGSLQAPGVGTTAGSPTFRFIERTSVMNTQQQSQLLNNNAAAAYRRIATTVTARHLAAVMRTEEVLPQPSGPFFDLPYEEDEEDNDENQNDAIDISEATDDIVMRMNKEPANTLRQANICTTKIQTLKSPPIMTQECFINDIDWLYASLHMPLYATG